VARSEPAKRPSTVRRDGAALAKFITAAAIGMGLSRFLPTLGPDQAVVAAIGEDLRRAASAWAKNQASGMILPAPGERFGIVNLAAIAAALLIAGRSKPGS